MVSDSFQVIFPNIIPHFAEKSIVFIKIDNSPEKLLKKGKNEQVCLKKMG